MRLRLLAALLIASCTACSDDGGNSSSSDTGSDTIDTSDTGSDTDAGADASDVSEDVDPEPTLLTVADDGSLELRIDDRTLVALAPDGPRLRTFDERASTSVGGIWEFDRIGEEETALAWGQPRAEGQSTVVDLAGEGEVSATLTATLDERTDGTHFRFEWTGLDAQAAAIPFRCDDDGTFHGFGEQYNATNQRGEAFQLIVSEQGIGREGGPLRGIFGDEHTTYFPTPFWLDARGFGALFETDRRVNVDLCAADDNVAWFEVVSEEPMEWTVFHGPTVLDVIDQHSDVVGRPTQPPAWAWEPWISIQGGQQAVLDEVDRLEANDIPFRAVWTQDWTGFRENIDGGSGVQYRWDVGEDLYPDLPALVAELDERGYRFLGYANPFVDAALEDFYPDMAEQGLLIQNEDGEPYVFSAPNGQSSLPDFTNPATREFVADALIAMVEDYGMDGWMSDFGEVMPRDAVLFDGSDPRSYHNRFVVDWHATVRQAFDEVRPDGDWVSIARSGWTGVQGVAMIHWVGDQEANWSESDGIPTVVPALINLGLSGQPYTTLDIGGFSGGPSTKELYLRWTELGAFAPVMRTHEGNRKEQNWNWSGGPDEDDPETIAHFRRFARIHNALGDELEQWATEAQETGMPMVRHMMLEFPDDPETYALSHQYMLGDSLLVAPVVEEGAEEQELYLPEGTWFHVWTGDEYDGGATITVDAQIGEPPVFSREVDRADLRNIE